MALFSMRQSVSYAVPTRSCAICSDLCCVGTAYENSRREAKPCHRLCPPYKLPFAHPTSYYVNEDPDYASLYPGYGDCPGALIAMFGYV